MVQTALRGGLQGCGQNCAGAERFIVHERVFAEFVARASEVAARLRQGAATGGAGGTVDCGAMCMPDLAAKVQGLVDDAVALGAKVR